LKILILLLICCNFSRTSTGCYKVPNEPWRKRNADEGSCVWWYTQTRVWRWKTWDV